ncbi:hypothetical protein GCM10023259_101600 [Thermocatellispora tengchongensis]
MVRLPAPGPPQARRARCRLAPPGLTPRASRPSRVVHSVDPTLDIRDEEGIVWDMPADPLLVVRRHVDFLRVRSAICIDAR